MPVSAEIGVEVTGGSVATVTVKDARGGAVAGKLRDDGSSWMPSRPLQNKQRYAATVTASDGTSAATSFTTMAKPSRETGTGLYLFDDHTYGVAMPVVVEFVPGIKAANRAAVQMRLLVQTDPPQPGAWSWVPSGTQAYYRAPQYWGPGTKLTVRIAVGGLPTGGGRYGDQDRSASATIGRSLIMMVENSTKKMTVIQDGRTIRTMPVSLGKPSTPSSSGTMVVMDKHTSTVFDTTDTDGAAGYQKTIAYAQRLTWSGQFIHSASWSVGDQGHRNVSHGCMNLSRRTQSGSSTGHCRRPDHRARHRGQVDPGQRVDAMGPELERLRQEQRPAGARRPWLSSRSLDGNTAGTCGLTPPARMSLREPSSIAARIRDW